MPLLQTEFSTKYPNQIKKIIYAQLPHRMNKKMFDYKFTTYAGADAETQIK